MPELNYTPSILKAYLDRPLGSVDLGLQCVELSFLARPWQQGEA